jgi:aminoglycoside 6'-N-acetyltransferase I
MHFLVRRMEKDDAPVWAGMRHALWTRMTREEHLAEIEGTLMQGAQARGYIVLAETGVEAGFAEVCIRSYANGCTRQPVPFLEGIWVEPAHRRAGVGGLLIDVISRELSQEGFVELCSDADIDNIQSHLSHASWGFAETQRVVFFRKSL